MKNLSLLGSTGSIGVNVLNIARQFPDRFRICGLAAIAWKQASRSAGCTPYALCCERILLGSATLAMVGTERPANGGTTASQPRMRSEASR